MIINTCNKVILHKKYNQLNGVLLYASTLPLNFMIFCLFVCITAGEGCLTDCPSISIENDLIG